jgi:glycosyltransferase involved in cell wall biosynthesis
VWNNRKISVILPAYNEEPNIAAAVAAFRALSLADEIIVVDNNSSDRTAQKALGAGARVVPEPRQGFGCALRRGMAEAEGDLLVLCEPDGTFEARDLHKLLSYSDDFDRVLGTRTTQGRIWKGANRKPSLRLGNLAVAKLLELFFGGPSLSDCGCTFRLLTRRAYQTIGRHLTVEGSHFLPEMVIYGLVRRLRIIEIPVNYRGRIGIFELLLLSDMVRDLIVHRAPSTEIKAQAVKEGMRTLRDDGLEKVITGISTIDESLRVVYVQD